MFVVTKGDEASSQSALEEVHAVERELFDELGDERLGQCCICIESSLFTNRLILKAKRLGTRTCDGKKN